MLPLSAEEEVKILRIIDGDTVSVESRGTEIKIRLSEIDAPEMGQPFGTNSKKCLSELIRENSGLKFKSCLLYTSPSPRDKRQSRMPSSA